MTLAQEIEALADGEPIEAVVVGEFGGGEFTHGLGDRPDIEPGRLMAWKDARSLLDYEYDAGYGLTDCHPLVAWTQSWVIVVHEYDGSTWPIRWPRNPTDITPGFTSKHDEAP